MTEQSTFSSGYEIKVGETYGGVKVVKIEKSKMPHSETRIITYFRGYEQTSADYIFVREYITNNYRIDKKYLTAFRLGFPFDGGLYACQIDTNGKIICESECLVDFDAAFTYSELVEFKQQMLRLFHDHEDRIIKMFKNYIREESL